MRSNKILPQAAPKTKFFALSGLICLLIGYGVRWFDSYVTVLEHFLRNP